MKIAALVIAASCALPLTAAAQQLTAPKVKLLATPEDPRQRTILVGRSEAADMIIQFEIEPATTMLITMGTPPQLMEHAPAAGEVYHIEVKPIDPRSKTRIPYTNVVFEAANRDTGKSLKGNLHAMWGGSGLHYALNSALLGDGTYDAVITVQPPTLARTVKDKGLFSAPAAARFHFKLKNGALIEVSEAIPAPN